MGTKVFLLFCSGKENRVPTESLIGGSLEEKVVQNECDRLNKNSKDEGDDNYWFYKAVVFPATGFINIDALGD